MCPAWKFCSNNHRGLEGQPPFPLPLGCRGGDGLSLQTRVEEKPLYPCFCSVRWRNPDPKPWYTFGRFVFLLSSQPDYKPLDFHLIPCCPLLLLPSIFPSIRVFSNKSVLPIRWPKYWSFSFSISPSNEHSGLISFRMDWLDLLAVQGTLKSLLQHHNSKASILRRSALFIVQLSHPYMIAGKTIALTRQTYVGKLMSLLLNMLSRLIITFLPRSKCLLISWLQSPSGHEFE